MGKTWRDDQGKLTTSSSCFMKVWQMCREHRKKGAERKGREKEKSIEKEWNG